MFPSEIVQITVFVFLLGLGSEIVLYLWCYRSPSFRAINASITKQSRKLEAAQATSYSAKQATKKQERLQAGLKQEATKELAVLKVKQTVVASIISAQLARKFAVKVISDQQSCCAVSSRSNWHVRCPVQTVSRTSFWCSCLSRLHHQPVCRCNSNASLLISLHMHFAHMHALTCTSPGALQYKQHAASSTFCMITSSQCMS